MILLPANNGKMFFKELKEGIRDNGPNLVIIRNDAADLEDKPNQIGWNAV